MVRMDIANIVLSQEPQFIESPVLLCRSNGQVVFQDGGVELRGPATFDFTTYFNALSLKKWKSYTVAQKFGLHLELKGAACTVQLTRADSLSYETELIEGEMLSIPASATWQSIDIDLPSNDEDVLEAFIIKTEGVVQIGPSHYFTEVNEEDIRDVELAICPTTFKKESYITKNIDLVRTHILSSDSDIAHHLQMHVVDNGRTLDVEALSGNGITIHPNDNAGGAGGFARGMIEAMNQTPQATHVLLMDDDIVISVESIIRTYNLLKIVNSEYEDAFISGAMMKLNDPAMRWEDIACISFEGRCTAMKPPAHMEYFNDMVNEETFEPPINIPGFEDERQMYAAWWYCVIPMKQIKKNGLPLPIFVRFDDVEYGRRCEPKFMSMIGICVWHEAFDLRYNAAQERYQTIRNGFIDQATTNIAPYADYVSIMDTMFQLDLKKFDYDDAELILRGFEDFLKGPEWIMQPVAQQAFMDANKDKEKLVPFEELSDEALSLGIDLMSLTRWDIERELRRKPTSRAMDYFSIGGNRFTDFCIIKGKTAIINAAGHSYQAGKMHGADTIIAIDMPSRKAVIRKIDRKRFDELWSRYKHDLHEYRRIKDDLNQAYKEARPQMTSVAFWREYLHLDKDNDAKH